MAQFKNNGDICHDQVLIVLKQIEKYMGKYPNPQDAVKAMRFTARVNFGRDEAIQRGEGVRRGRIVGQFPTRETDEGEALEVEFVDQRAIDPETQAVQRDECARLLVDAKPVVVEGLFLTAINGYNQGEAADKMQVSRTYLSRQMKQSERNMQNGQQDAP